MAAKLCAIGVLALTLIFFVACVSESPESAPPTPPPLTAAPTPLPPTATPPPLPPTATPTPKPAATPTPKPTATLAPDEVIANQAEDLAGVWRTRFNAEPANWQYNADGTFALAGTDVDSSLPTIRGRFWFEGTLMNVTDSTCGVGGVYEVRVRRQGDTPIELTHLLINDPCDDRAAILSRPMPWVEP